MQPAGRLIGRSITTELLCDIEVLQCPPPIMCDVGARVRFRQHVIAFLAPSRVRDWLQ